MTRWIAVIASLAMNFAMADSAWAHAKLTASKPADGATVTTGLEAVTLTFSKDVRMTMVKLAHAHDGAEVAVMSEMPKGFTREVSVIVAPLAAGSYEANWIAVAKDGHIMKGAFSFTVGAPRSAESGNMN